MDVLTDIIPGDVTDQGTTNTAFDDDERANPVTQMETDGGPRPVRMELGPGFYAAPVPGERVHGVEYDGAVYGIGGTNVPAVESIAPAQGDRGMYAVDASGAVVAHIQLTGDGGVTVSNNSGDFTLQANGEVSINDGNLRVLP